MQTAIQLTMANVRFISDLHLGHKNVAIWRGFNNLDDYHNHIITNWNSVVDKRDVVYILGDVVLDSKYYPILAKSKGIKYFILGNHDEKQHVHKLLEYGRIMGPIKYNGKYWLTHQPIHPECLRANEVNIHGHLHDLDIINDGIYSVICDNPNHRYFNVSCEKNNFKPQTIADLKI